MSCAFTTITAPKHSPGYLRRNSYNGVVQCKEAAAVLERRNRSVAWTTHCLMIGCQRQPKAEAATLTLDNSGNTIPTHVKCQTQIPMNSTPHVQFLLAAMHFDVHIPISPIRLAATLTEVDEWVGVYKHVNSLCMRG